jgi:hypothetical protein
MPVSRLPGLSGEKNTLMAPENSLKWRVLLDLNVILYVLMRREPFLG